jgi:beta-galactosidase
VNFASGTIRAVGINGGKIAATFELRTAGKPAKIVLAADKNTITNRWDDVVFVNAAVVDENGTLVPDADNLINFAAEGGGFVAAVDSADSNSHEPYEATQRKAFQGMCLALLKANRDKGKIKITSSSPGLKSGAIEVSVSQIKLTGALAFRLH